MRADRYLKKLADSLDAASRLGADTDTPEGDRFIQISDTCAKEIAESARFIAKGITAVLLDEARENYFKGETSMAKKGGSGKGAGPKMGSGMKGGMMIPGMPKAGGKGGGKGSCKGGKGK